VIDWKKIDLDFVSLLSLSIKYYISLFCRSLCWVFNSLKHNHSEGIEISSYKETQAMAALLKDMKRKSYYIRM